MYDIEKDTIEKQLNERIDSFTLIKETSCSFLYHVKAQKQYILKKSKAKSISEQFNNHKKIYECWLSEKENLNFKIPEVYFLSNDEKYYVMEYISGAIDLLQLMFQNKNNAAEIFKRAGESMNQYHTLTTKSLFGGKQSMLEHNTIKQLLDSKAADKARAILDSFSEDTCRIIFKDFTLSNMVLDDDGNIYLIDCQKIYYYAPLYYDLARFIDTGKVFALVKKPLFFLLNCGKINAILNSFLNGYNPELNRELLKKMQWLHRAEHIQMKANKNKLDAVILKLIYCII